MRVGIKDIRPRKLCSIQSGNGCPQRSQLQPGVPSLGCCVTLLPATFCNLGLGDSLSSCNKRIVLISYSFFSLQSLLRPKPTCDDRRSLALGRGTFLYLIVDDRASHDERQGNFSCLFTTFFRLNTLRCFCHRGVGKPNAVSNAIGYAMPATVHTML